MGVCKSQRIRSHSEKLESHGLQGHATMRRAQWKVRAAVILIWVTGPLLAQQKAPEVEVKCPTPRPPIPEVARSEVYQAYPFKSGEESKYELKYGALKVLVGYGYLRVGAPVYHDVKTEGGDGKPVALRRPLMALSAEAYTGDWYKMVFAGHDKIQAFSRPWDFGIQRFYISQNEEKPFVRRTHSEKWLDFEHYDCKVHERTVDHGRGRKGEESFDLMYGAVDALGAVFRLRTLSHELNKPEKFVVYTSEKNWELEATPVAHEKVQVKAGTFETVKLELKTFLGKDLQQRGKVFVWIAHQHPSRPVVKVEGEVTFGSVYLLLDRFTPGA